VGREIRCLVELPEKDVEKFLGPWRWVKIAKVQLIA
jgi:hypothetical protein